VRQRLK